MFNLLRFFVGNRSGNVAIQFGLLLIPVVGVIGGSVDFSRHLSAQTEVQAALDNAVLAAARHAELSDAERKTLASDVFDAGLSSNGRFDNVTLTMTISEGGAAATADASMKTTLMHVAGISSLSIKAESEALFTPATEIVPTEFVFVMDATNSVRSISKSWDDMVDTLNTSFESILAGADSKTAAANCPETGETPPSSNCNSPYVRVSFVPMGDRINLSEDRENWLSTTKSNWKGCMEPRYDPITDYEFMLSDEPPTSDNLFDPTYNGNKAAMGGHGNATCPIEAAIGSTDLEFLTDTVDDVKNAGTGRFDLGLAWAWRMLSPKWQGYWGENGYPRDYGKARKVIAILTDSYTTAWEKEVIPSTGLKKVPWNQITDDGFRHIEKLCETIKDEGIELHIFLYNSYERAEEPWQNCATSSETFYEVEDLPTFVAAVEQMDVYQQDLRISK